MNKFWALCLSLYLGLFSANILLNHPIFRPPILGSNLSETGRAQKGKAQALLKKPLELDSIQQPASLPALVVDLSAPSASLGTLVVISIRVENAAQPVSAFQFDLVYPAAILAFESIQPGAFPGSTGNLVVCPVEAFPDSGVLRKACVSAGASSGPTGSGVLAEVSLRVIAPGEAHISLENAFLVNQGVPPEKIQVNVVPATLLAGVDAGLAIGGTQAQSGAPGAEVLYSLVLTNTGTYTDSYTLSAESGWGTDRLEADQTSSLAPGETFDIQLWVEVPDSAPNLQQNITTVTGVSQLDPGTTSQFQVVTTVEREGYLIFLPLILR